MKRVRFLIAALFVVAGALAATAGSAQAATIVVNPGQSIQAALNVASPGDTVLVRPGVYREELVMATARVKLMGSFSTLLPPAVLSEPCGELIGICIVASGVTVSGFNVNGFNDGFEGSGILAFEVDHTTFTNNQANKNAEYGLVAFETTNTTMSGNKAVGNGEAGLYVGDSPVGNFSVHDNSAQGNAFGLLVRDAQVGNVMTNKFTNNCAGIAVVADAPGPAGHLSIQSNTVSNNSAACDTEVGPVSGAGIVLSGADHVGVHGNDVEFNVPTGFTVWQGGVVVISGIGFTPAQFNSVTGNTILHNTPDLFWDGFGIGNVLKPNKCHSSFPSGLCSGGGGPS
jgi:parallel beta-helix repeat protein